MDSRSGQDVVLVQQQMVFCSRENERWQLLNNLWLLGRSAAASRVRSLVELVARVAGDGELCWKVDGPPDARDCLCSRLNLPERTMRRTIEAAEHCGSLLVARVRRADRSYDRLALRVNWARLASRQLSPVGDRDATGPVRPTRPDGPANLAAPDRPTRPDGPANLAAPDRPTRPDGPANLAGQYMQKKQIPPPPPTTTATATAATPRGDTGPRGGTSWEDRAAAAAAEKSLRETGFASWRRLLAECRAHGITPADLVHACETYTANSHKFAGPGAIAAWVRNGDWPVNGVQPPEAALVRLVTVEKEQAGRELEAWAYRVIADGQRRGLSRSQIAETLRQRGYAWS